DEVAEQVRAAALERERSGARRRTAGIYGGEALYTRPEARRLGEGSADETKEREAAVLLDPAARADSEGVLAASEARGEGPERGDGDARARDATATGGPGGRGSRRVRGVRVDTVEIGALAAD